MDERAEFAQLLAGLQAGDPAAVATVARRYGPALRAAVRRQLHPRLRSRFDSLDLVQDVWASFLALPPERLRFDHAHALLAYLTTVAYRRTVDVFRERFESEKSDVAREDPKMVFAPDRDQVPDPGPTPSVCVSADEEWERLVNQFPPGHRVILRRLREGYDLRDIAAAANVSLSTVNRVVRRLKEMTGL